MPSATRRDLLARSALAAAAGAAFPAVALSSGAPDSDARLVGLGRTFHAYYTWEGVSEPAEGDEATMRAYADP